MVKTESLAPNELREKVKASLPSVKDIMNGPNAPQLVDAQNNIVEAENSSQDTAEKPQIEEENKDISQSEEKIEPKEVDYEQQARDSGWAPKDEYRGDPKLWVNAQEWVSRAPLLHKISQQSKEMKNMAKTNEAMAEMLKNLAERANKDRANTILNQKRDAIEQGDVAAVEQYEKEYSEILKESEAIAKKIPNQPNIASETQEFLQRNSNWFNDKPENLPLTAYAKMIEGELMNTRPELSLEQRLLETERIVKDDPRYKSRFTNQNRDRAPMVEGKTAPVIRTKGKVTFAECPQDVKQVLRQLKQVDSRLDLDKMAQDLLDSGAIRHE